MRRDINIRKRKKIILKDNNKKKLIILSILIVLLIIFFITCLFFSQDFYIKKSLEEDGINFSNLNENIPFSVQKIILFSSATAETNSINHQLTLDISQFSDIAIHLNKVHSESNSVSSLYVDNIVITSPELGTPYLYKKTISDLGKCSFNEENIINGSSDFNVIDSDQDINYDNFEIYNNGTTPITLGFYNKNIKTDFFPNKSEILYNGTLLRDATIPTASLNCNISFRLNIITISNEHYICNINFDIPFKYENSSIYDTGYVTKELENNETNKFIRIK